MAINFLANAAAAGPTTLTSPTITPAAAGDWLLVCSSYFFATDSGGWAQFSPHAAGGVNSQIAPSTAPINYTFSPISGSGSVSNLIFDLATDGSTPQILQEVSFGGGGIGSSGQATFGSSVAAGLTVLAVFQNNTFFATSGAMTLTDNSGNMYYHFASAYGAAEPKSQIDVFIAFDIPATSSLTMNWASANSIGDGEGTAWTISHLAPIPPTAPTIFLQAVPGTIMQGQSSLLNWVVTGATSQSIDEGIGAVPSTGEATVEPASSTFYHLTAENAGGLPLSFPPLVSSGYTDNDTSLLLFVAGATFYGDPGTAFSVTLGSSEFQGLTITQACIQSTAASGTIPPPGGYTVDQNVPITFGGLGSVTIAAGQTLTSDTISFPFDDSHDYYVVLFTDNASQLGIAYGAAFGAGGNVEVCSQQPGNQCLATTTYAWSQDTSYWRVFEGMTVTRGSGGITETAVAEVQVTSNAATFGLSKAIVTLKQDRIPVRGKNG